MAKIEKTNGPLVNQLGTGAIPAEQESALIHRGIKFAAYFESPNGPRCLVTSTHSELYQRLGQQLEQFYDEAHGLPLAYRLPAPVLSLL